MCALEPGWLPQLERREEWVRTARFPPRGPILVVAPHPDDESLGCGGLIAAAVRRGERVHTVFVTDGGASHRNSASWTRTRLAARREAEAIEALKRLGAEQSPRSFLGLPDADMPSPNSSAYRIAKAHMVSILRYLSPAFAIIPWRRDPHCDHRDSWSLVMDSLSAADHSCEVLEYAIWLDELGLPEDRPRPIEMEILRFDISDVVDAKKHAVRAHRSQLGQLILDDPSAFVLSDRTIERLTGPEEVYWRPCVRE
ncbi:PIG-L family deacetylase [Aquibium carbonis]|uniref:PIG-L family deacetylase n=1 Tax=Aquibium carbonis TaxID=2495581 RepID=A0A3R9YHA1_9HYPH|nr:PIG-L deacetylase family protein [Aquibium carbonis]RST87718.1 PIG-L family deacetylase [Aquibium carbonis]